MLRLKADGVKIHVYFNQVDWSSVRDQSAPFTPAPQDQTDTSYFDGKSEDFAQEFF